MLSAWVELAMMVSMSMSSIEDRNDADVLVHEMYLMACVMRFKQVKTCGRHLGSDCDDDHISSKQG
jgi:hypothetical protein